MGREGKENYEDFKNHIFMILGLREVDEKHDKLAMTQVKLIMIHLINNFFSLSFCNRKVLFGFYVA